MATHTSRGSRRDAGAGNGAAHPMGDLSRQAQRLGAELNDIGDTVRALVDGCRVAARVQLRRQPYVVLAVAAGVGYVLGGGLPRGVVRGLLTVGGRVILESVVANLAATPGARATRPPRST